MVVIENRGWRAVVMRGLLPWLLKYNFCVIVYRKGRKAKPTKSFATFAVSQIMKTSHPFFFSSHAAPSRLHSGRVPVLISPARSCREGAGWCFSIIQGDLFGVGYFVFRWVWLPREK